MADLRRGVVPHGVELSELLEVGGAEVGDELLPLLLRQLEQLDGRTEDLF